MVFEETIITNQEILDEANAIASIFDKADAKCYNETAPRIAEVVPLMMKFIRKGIKRSGKGSDFPEKEEGYFLKAGVSRFFQISVTTWGRWKRIARWPALLELAEKGELTAKVIDRSEWQLDEDKGEGWLRVRGGGWCI